MSTILRSPTFSSPTIVPTSSNEIRKVTRELVCTKRPSFRVTAYGTAIRRQDVASHFLLPPSKLTSHVLLLAGVQDYVSTDQLADQVRCTRSIELDAERLQRRHRARIPHGTGAQTLLSSDSVR